MKRAAIACCVLVLFAGLLTGCGGNSGSGGAGIHWVKSSFSDRTACIVTDAGMPGTATDPSGREHDVDLTFIRTAEAFRVTIGGADWYGGSSGEVDAEIVYSAGSGMRQPFSGRMEGSGCTVLFGLDSIGYFNYALDGSSGEGTVLEMTLPDGSVIACGFAGSDYAEVMEKFALSMKIPSYSDELHDGKGVNPDLEAFFAEFVPVFNDEVEYWAEHDGVLGSVLQLLEASSNEKFARMWAQYKAMNPLPRDVDAEFYGGFAVQINQIVGMKNLKASWTVAQGCMDAMDKMVEVASEW